MSKEELEKEAEEYAETLSYSYKDCLVDIDDKSVLKEAIAEAYLAGAEPREKQIEHLSKEVDDLENMKATLESTIAELKAQIEKMKCGGNCKHLYHVNTGGCYDAKCDLTYCDCINCKDKWELRR